MLYSEIRGPGYPLMNLHERSLSVLGCRYVDEIIMGAPWKVTLDMVRVFFLVASNLFSSS